MSTTTTQPALGHVPSAIGHSATPPASIRDAYNLSCKLHAEIGGFPWGKLRVRDAKQLAALELRALKLMNALYHLQNG